MEERSYNAQHPAGFFQNTKEPFIDADASYESKKLGSTSGGKNSALRNTLINRFASRLGRQSLRNSWFTHAVACGLPCILIPLIKPWKSGNLQEFLFAILVYAIPTVWAFILAGKIKRNLETERRLLVEIERCGQNLQAGLDNGTMSIRLDGNTWENFVQGAQESGGTTCTSVRMVQNLCHEAASGRFPPISTFTQIYAAEFREGVRRLRVPQTLSLRLGILGTFIGLLLALSNLGGLVQEATVNPLKQEQLAPLIQSMMVAFGTSVAGLLSAIFIQILAEATLLRQQGLTRQIEDAVGRVATVLARSLTGSTFMRDLDAFGVNLTRHSTDLKNHADQVRGSSRDAIDAVERHAGVLDGGVKSMADAQKAFGQVMQEVRATLAQVQTSLDGLSELDTKFGQQLQSALAARDDALASASKAGMDAVASALKPLQASIEAHAEQVKSNTTATSAALQELLSVARGIALVSHQRSPDLRASVLMRLVTILVGATLLTNIGVIVWLAMRLA